MSDWKLKSYKYYADKYGVKGDEDIIDDWDAKKYGEGSDKGVARIIAEDIRRMAEAGAGLENIVSYYDSGKFDKYRHGGGTERMVDAFRGNIYDSDGGGGGGDGGGGGGKTSGPSNKKGLSYFKGTEGMTPAEFDLYKDIKLRGIDAANANKLQGIINSGKKDVAVIQRDASIYGSLVSGFW